MRVIFVARAINDMAGGVERMITTVMNALHARGHSISLLTWDNRDAVSFYPINEGISWDKLDIGDASVKAGLTTRLRRAVCVRKAVRERRPDIVVCFQDGPFAAIRLFTMGMNIPVIAAERNAPTRFEHKSTAVWQKWLFYLMFYFAKRILIQCESYRCLYPRFLRGKIVTIPNPVNPASQFAQPAVPDSSGRFKLLSVGRLSYQKNYPVLIQAFALIASDLPEWDLVIIGEGEDRSYLEKMVIDNSLTDRVSLPGTSSKVSDCYAASHLCCLSSRWEGFPNVLAEALAHGLPGVGFADCAGVRDLLSAGVNGLLADGNDDGHTLAESLKVLMAEAEDRCEFGKKGICSVSEYVPDKIFSQWERVLTEAIMK